MKNNKKMQKTRLTKFLSASNKYKSEENLKKICQIEKIIKELHSSLGIEKIENIMKTHKDCEYGVKFLKFLELDKYFSSKEISKKLNVSNHLINDWYRCYPPRPIRTLLNIYFNKYHKVSKEDWAYLFGWGFGDGGINKSLSYYFICGKKQDLEKIKIYLENKIPELPIVIADNNGNNLVKQANGKIKRIKGTSWILYIRDSSFCKLIHSSGLPKGNKVLQETKIPNWIKNGNKKTKKAFLNTLFEGELQKHKVQFNQKKNKVEICPITFGLSKIEDYRDNLVDFLNEIRKMMNEFNIKSYKVEKPKPSNIRKDGFVTYSSRFYISISAENTLSFSKLIDYPFNLEKKESLNEAIIEANIKLKRMKSQVKKYEKALILSENGQSIYKISKELGIEYNTARHWIKTKKHLPTLLMQNKNKGDICE